MTQLQGHVLSILDALDPVAQVHKARSRIASSQLRSTCQCRNVFALGYFGRKATQSQPRTGRSAGLSLDTDTEI